MQTRFISFSWTPPVAEKTKICVEKCRVNIFQTAEIIIDFKMHTTKKTNKPERKSQHKQRYEREMNKHKILLLNYEQTNKQSFRVYCLYIKMLWYILC